MASYRIWPLELGLIGIEDLMSFGIVAEGIAMTFILVMAFGTGEVLLLFGDNCDSRHAEAQKRSKLDKSIGRERYGRLNDNAIALDII